MPLNDCVEASVTTKSALFLASDMTYGRLLIPRLGVGHEISAAVHMLEGIMGCCTEVAEGRWKTAAVALFSLDAGLSELIRVAAVWWGSRLLGGPKVLPQTFHVWVMMPQACHSCHTTATTFFWERGQGGGGARVVGGRGASWISQDAETDISGICLILHLCMLWKYWFIFQSGKERPFPSEVIGNLDDLSSGF